MTNRDEIKEQIDITRDAVFLNIRRHIDDFTLESEEAERSVRMFSMLAKHDTTVIQDSKDILHGAIQKVGDKKEKAKKVKELK